MSFTIIDVKPDTPAWEQDRRGSIGASELAAAMNLSPYATPRDVWKHKKGIDRPFDAGSAGSVASAARNSYGTRQRGSRVMCPRDAASVSGG